MATTTNSKTYNGNVDPLNWVRTAKAMEGSHLDEVKSFVQTFFECEEVSLEGTTLTVAHVAAVARRPEVHVVLNAAVAKRRVDESSNWILESVRKGSQIPGVTTGFGAAGHRRTNQAVELQQELIRFLLAGVLQDTGNALSVCNTRAAMLVRTNTLLQGYSGLRWEILEALGKLLNHNVNPVLPLRGSITDLIPLAYIAGILTGRPDSMAITGDGKTVSAIEALNIAGIEAIELQPKEGLAMVNGTAVGSSLAAIVCFDANILVILAEVMAALFCEVMQGKPGFADPLTHKLKHHPGQIEAAAIMEWVLEGSMYMKAASDPSNKPKGQDRYALRTSPQWLGPQVEAIRNATHSIQREINSMVDNPIIDAAGDRALSGGNFQGTPIGVAMDHVRLALAAIGKLIFAQFSELLNDSCNNGLPPSLNGGANPSLDYGLKGAEITMAAYLSELNYLANPVTTHAQSAEQHNQAVNSLGLISARKTEEAVHILNLMSSTFLVALCQAIDLRHVAETMQMTVKTNVDQVAQKIFTGLGSGFHPIKDGLLKVVDHQPIFTYIDDASSKTNPLMEKLKLVLLEHALQSCKIDKAKATAVFHLIDEFEDTLSARLDTVVLAVREAYDTNGLSAVRNKIEQCRSYPLYKFVRGDLQTHLLTGKSVGPGKDIEKVYIAICKGRHVAPLLRCLEGWHGAPGPSSPCRNAAASQAMNRENRSLVTDEPVAFQK